MVGHVKSSGIDNLINTISGSDRRENPELKSGGDFLSILKSAAEFKETRTAEREETIQKPYSEDKPAVSDKIADHSGPVESSFNVKQNHETAKLNETRETGSGLKSPAESPLKTEANKKTSEKRDEQKERRGETDSITAAAGELFIKKNLNVKLPQTAEVKSAGEKLSGTMNRENSRSTSGLMRNTDSLKGNPGDDGIQQKNSQVIRSGINEVLEAAGRGTGKNSSARKGMEQGSLNPHGSRETEAALHGLPVKEKVKDERSAVSRNQKPAEAVAGDKKNIDTAEGVQQKQKLNGDQASFNKGTASGNDSGRDNSQVAGGRAESASRLTSGRTENMAKMPEFRQSLQEIIDRARVTVQDSRNGSFTVKLFPKELGSVNVNLVMENGVVNGRFLVDNNDAKTVLLSSIENLIDELQQSGVSVGEFSVNVRDERERFIREKDELKYKINPVLSGNKEAVTAADVYDHNSVYKHNGSINMII